MCLSPVATWRVPFFTLDFLIAVPPVSRLETTMRGRNWIAWSASHILLEEEGKHLFEQLASDLPTDEPFDPGKGPEAEVPNDKEECQDAVVQFPGEYR